MDEGKTDADDLLANFPWPKPGPALFGPDGDWWNNAVLNPAMRTWWAYAEGYSRGAAILVQHVLDSTRGQDFLVYPIVFLYRHHLELALKDLIRAAGDLVDRTYDTSKEHRLNVLWKDAKSLLEDVWPQGDEETLAAVELRISELAAVDNGSFSFRYPETNGGSPSLPVDLAQINIRKFGEVMAEVASFFGACRTGISSMKQAKDEYERDVRSEYGDGRWW